MSKPDQALLAKLSKLSPAQREALLKKLQQKKSQKAPSISALPITVQDRDGQDFALSFAQQRLWFLEQLNPGQATYNIAAALRLSGPLKIELLNQTFKRIIQRHESLRTVFIPTSEGAQQRVLDSIDWNMDSADLTQQSANGDTGWISDEANSGFDLEHGPLFRAKLLKMGENEHLLTIVMHHIISDAWSCQLLLGEVSKFYTALHQGTAIVMPAPQIQYIDYSQWQREHLIGDIATQQLQYWQQKLADNSNFQLPCDKPRPNTLSYNGATIRQTLSGASVKQLKKHCQTSGNTLYIALMSVFQTLLYRHTEQQDFCIGTPVAGRNHGDLEPLIGFFVNSLAITNNANGEESFNSLLNKVKRTMLEAQSHQDIPFEQLVDAISPERDSSYSPIFQVFFSYNPGNADEQIQLPNIDAKFITADTDTAKFDLSLIISDKTVDGEDVLVCHFEYNTDLYGAAQIERLSQHFSTLITQACAMPEAPLHQLQMLTAAEYTQATTLQGASSSYPVSDIASLIEQQVQRTPDNIAVCQGSDQLSFNTLNRKANQLAHYLQAQGVKSGDTIGLCFPPSIALSTALFAAIKLGAVYVPMDPSYPADRLSYMAEHAQLKLLLSAQRVDTAAINIAHKVNIDELDLSAFATDNLERDIDIQQALYVIYTSGSTGLPKAAMVSHANECNLLNWYANNYHCTSDDKLLVFSAIGFDLTQKNLLMPLVSGAQLHFSAQELYDPEILLKTIAEHQISWVNCAPSAFYPIVDACTDFSQLQSLNNIFFGGETIQLGNLANWMHSPYCQTRIHNMYGPTECTDIATSHTLKTSQAASSNTPIGLPADNISLFILDQYLNPMPKGAIGELYIGGKGVGLGYLNNPAITAERFIASPFAHDNNTSAGKLYKSGDLVRLQESGELEFIARSDDQIKIRGFRIELGEIENQLRHIHDVQDAVVCTRSISGQTQLLAFIQSSKDLQEQHFYKHSLNQHLPDYMVPIAFFPIDEIPLSANGKIARNKLPEVDLSQLKQSEYIAPRNTDEASLAVIWQNLLGIDNIGVRDNFFELGGHSLLATQMLTRIRDTFEVEFPLRTIFEVSTIEGLVEIISAMQPLSSAHDPLLDAEDDEAFEEGIL